MWTIDVYMKSGHTVKVKCKQYSFSYNNTTLDYVGYEFKGTPKNTRYDLVPSQIAGFTAKKRSLK